MPRTVDQIVRQHIGDLVVQAAEILARAEAAEAKCAALERELAALTASASSGA